MRLLSALIITLLMPVMANASIIVAGRRGAEVLNQCYGITAIGGSEGSVNNEFMIKADIPAGGSTLTHAYFYGNTTDGGSDGTFSVVVFESDKSTVAISETGDYPMVDGASPQWNEIPLGSHFLSEGTYWVQICPSEAFDYYWTASSSDCFYENVTCPSPASANTCSQTPSFKVRNYDAHDYGGDGDEQSYYVTQSGAGSRNGLSLANAWAVSDFHLPANWSGSESPGAIDPGDIVYFSGSITTTLEVKGSGESGKYITLDGTSATIDVDTSGTPTASIVHYGYDYIKYQHFDIDGNLTMANSQSEAYPGLWIQGYETNPAQYIVVDDVEVQNHRAGVLAYDNVDYLTITNCYLHNLNGNGINIGLLAGHESWGKSTNITIGGSAGNGNTIYNTGYNTYEGDWGSSPGIEFQFTEEVIVSHNHVYVDTAGYGWGGIMVQEGKYFLIEKNILHGFRSTHFRGGIIIKEDSQYYTNDEIIIRYNHVYDIITSGRPTPWGGEVSGINVGSDVKDAFIYGNYIHDTHWGIRIMENFSGDDGRDNENIYVMANIVAETEEEGICFNGTVGNYVNNKVFNNTVYKSSTDNSLLTATKGAAISLQNAGAGMMDSTEVKNNLVINSRPNYGDEMGILWPVNDSDVLMDWNHHYHTGGTPTVYFNSTLYNWNGAIPYNIGDNDSAGNPYLTDPDNDDFTLTGSSGDVDPGEGTDMGSGNIDTVTIQGTGYAVPWDIILGDTTSYHNTDPDSITIEELSADVVGWPIGAFAE